MKVRFHGILKKICPKECYEIFADTPAEAIRGVTMQIKELKRFGTNRWVCKAKECPTRDSLYAHNPQDLELNLYPDYSPAGGGGGRPGTLQMVIGAVILVVSVALAAYTGGGSIAAGFEAYSSLQTAAMFGVGMMLSGLATMISTPEVDNKDSNEVKSRMFGSRKNTTEIGTRIAVGYGRYKLYGQLLSINTESFNS